MAVERLLSAIEAEAREEIETELDRGRSEARALESEARERGERERREALEREEARLWDELAPELAGARLEARRLVSRARERLVARVLEELEPRLARSVSSERYLASLPVRLEACFDYVGDGPVVVRAAPVLAPRLEKLTVDREGVSVEAASSLATGFVLVSGDGGLSVDATLERALEQRRREVEIEIFRRLEKEVRS